MSASPSFRLRPATERDVPSILHLIKELALYEKAPEKVLANEDSLRKTLFGEKPYAEVVLAIDGDAQDGEAIGMALFFHNYSTWLGKPGIYLEDLFVLTEHRNKGIGKALFGYLGKLAKERDCGRLDWSVLRWNAPSIAFYKSLGALSMGEEWDTMRLEGEPLQKLDALLPQGSTA
ncbi:acyl-CoA N-acyltransferase [Cystobasidium minutum MCA 4210]|uniref:acyl-CoA N-acyltransferase n=1 Tax=Cystobasidium minutum MCA 4210 TaxID=1397322 RepID=UPI0034CDDADC|eukprot:jgi/Rhomi1/195698/gm1.3912_g